MFFLFLIFSVVSCARADKFLLDGSDWKFFSYYVEGYSGKATVPGDIYTDLFNNGLIDNPLYGDGDQKFKWVGHTQWYYEKIFTLPKEAGNSSDYVLVFKSLDTIVTAYFNKMKIFQSKTMFSPVYLSVKDSINLKDANNLTLIFDSPVNYASKQLEIYKNTTGHGILESCAEFGECDINMIRKTQSSFSWDWGPSFATMGIADSVYLEYFNEATIYQVSPLITYLSAKNAFQVQIDVLIFCISGTSSLTVSVNFTELNLVTNKTSPSLNCQSGSLVNLSLTTLIPDANVQRWWPNGYGNQTLYTLNTIVLVGNTIVSQATKKIGFRTVELVQDPINPLNSSYGLSFYFKVNNIPIFLKGSNFVPISSFPAQNHTRRKQFLLRSVQIANMNTLRVWGGGVFERDEFYELADELGIMLWHDYMFACNLYPRDQEFLRIVENEITSQVTRLRHHPSILVWSGNNENELIIHAGYDIGNYTQAEQVVDYVALYVTLMQTLVNSLDPSRPFLLSSPTNGKETSEEGGVALKIPPSSELYGDVHFYLYFGNLWKTSSLQIPRCATEFGAQSVPLSTTMTRWVPANEWTYGSEWMTSRQHHPYGSFQNLVYVFNHFETPVQCPGYNSGNLGNCSYVNSSREFLNDFAYLSQVFQAIGMQTESEHYRRYRSMLTPEGTLTDKILTPLSEENPTIIILTNEYGRGGTMCALYWQLNDVWAAPTWSSIDLDLNWKVLHYYARRFFAPVIVSLYLNDNNQLNVYIVSDKQQDLIDHNIVLDIFTWENGFTPIYSFFREVNVPALNATNISWQVQLELNANNITLNDNDGFVVRAALYDDSMNPVSPPAILLPNFLHQITNPDYGDAIVKNVTPIDSQTFAITLTASKIVPVLWLDIQQSIKDKYQLLYWFIDNGFTMTEAEVVVELKIFSSNGSVSLGAQDLIVLRIKMASELNPSPSPKSATCPVNWFSSKVSKKCFNINNDLKSWKEGNMACGDFATGGSLVSIDNAFENSEITGILKNTTCSQAYIDLYEMNNTWVWANGDPSTYRNWELGHPVDDATRTCGRIQLDGKWTDEHCEETMCFICQLIL